ncbi:MAG: hypothetical protein VB087_10870 [Candidatus Limiplasma sp.]|nr:hypothetical protein [Candidatus Limiplasma sp.]
MKIDLSCPVELWQYTTPSEGNPECNFALNNLSDKVVTSVQMTLICHAAQGELLFRQTERFQGVSAAPGERFSVGLAPLQWEHASSLEVVIEKVWFDDATIWRRGTASLTEYEGNALPPGRRLDQLRFVAGPDAVGYPNVQERVWVCVCGRANPLLSDRCCRCERRRDTVFATCSRDNVEQLIAVHEQKLRSVAKAAREDTSRLAEEREAARLKALKKKRNLRIAALSGVAAAALLAAGAVWGLPALRYANAGALLTRGAYDDARAAYQSLGDYADARALLLECDYRKAESLAATGEAAALSEAAALYQSLGDYLESPARYQQAVYDQGMLWLGAGKYDAAAEAFLSLGTYRDSQTQLQESQYRQADKLFQDESYIAARILFEDLGAYRDAPDQVAACDLALGQAALAQGDFRSAVDKLTLAGTAEGAAELLQEACYGLAEQLHAAGDLEQAGILYQQAGDYADAALKANGSLYEQAMARMNAGDFAKAQALFTRISGYLDSETLAWECVYRQALTLYNTGDEGGAIDLLITIPKHEKGVDLLRMARYRQAGKLVTAGSTEEAATLYALLGDYQDAPTRLRDLRYTMAEAAYAAGDYAAAAPLYQALGRYKDSQDKFRQTQYSVATAANAAGEYRAAIEGFALLGNYKDSAAQLEAATYQLALNLKASGDVEEAIALLNSLPDNAQAKAQLSEITMSEAMKAQAAGDLDKASELYLALGDFGAARENYHAIQYELAMRRMTAGDYRAAAPLFAALGDYRDAAAQAAACMQEAYDRYAVPARAAYETKDWQTVVDTLADFDTANLPEAYADLVGMYEEACYQYAETLYDAGKPYEALPYYQRIPDYKDVAARKLTRRAYLILGVWESADGQRTAAFRQDGLCTLFGETLYFRVDGYGLWTGAQADALTLTHKLTTLSETALSIRVLSQGAGAVYPLQRKGDAAEAMALAMGVPAQGNAPAATPTADAAADTATLSPAGTAAAQTATPAATASPATSPADSPSVQTSPQTSAAPV